MQYEKFPKFHVIQIAVDEAAAPSQNPAPPGIQAQRGQQHLAA